MEGVNSGELKKGKKKERKGRERKPHTTKKKKKKKKKTPKKPRERVEFNIVSVYTLRKNHAPG